MNKNPDKIVIGIIDSGVFPWWQTNVRSPQGRSFHSYYDGFEIVGKDFIDVRGSEFYDQPSGSHGHWVMDRILEVCGSPERVKIVSAKIFSAKDERSSPLPIVLSWMKEQGVDLINMSIGIPRRYQNQVNPAYLTVVNLGLDQIVDQNGFALISAGNEGQEFSNGKVIENGNLLTDDPNNNLSVASHDRAGNWDVFSSAGGTVDVSAVGSTVPLVGKDGKVKYVDGTSFSAPTVTGVCGNYLLDRFDDLRANKVTVKEIIYDHLEDAINPVKDGKEQEDKGPWYGEGSFQRYAKWFINHYGRDVLRDQIFSNMSTPINNEHISSHLELL